MKLSGNPIEKGMLPLLDIAMLLFGIMIIVLTYAKFQEVGVSKDTDDSVAIGISLVMEESQTSHTNEDMKSNPVNIVENLVKRAMLEGRLIMLIFDVEGVVIYKGNVLFDGDCLVNDDNNCFKPEVLDLLIESIKEKDPMIIIGTPETNYHEVSENLFQKFKDKIEEYTNSVFFIGIENEEQQGE